MEKSDYSSGKASAVKFFMVLSCIAAAVGGIAGLARGDIEFGAIALVSLVWTIPMTIYACNSLNKHREIDMSFKICTLLFHNVIAGIILLCMKTKGEETEEEAEEESDDGETSASTATTSPTSRPATPTNKPTTTPTNKPNTAPTNRPTTAPTTSPTSRPTSRPAPAPNRDDETPQSKPTVKVFSKTLYRNFLIERGYSLVTPSGNPSTVDDYCHRIDFVCEIEDIEWVDIPAHIDRLLKEYGMGGAKQHLGAKSNNSVINALKRAYECIQKHKS